MDGLNATITIEIPTRTETPIEGGYVVRTSEIRKIVLTAREVELKVMRNGPRFEIGQLRPFPFEPETFTINGTLATYLP